MASLGSFSGGGLGMGVTFALKDGFSKPSRRIRGEMDKLSGSTRNTSNKVNKSLSGIMGGLGGLLAGGAVLAGLNNVIKLTAEFSDRMADVQKTTGLTNKELQDYRKTLEGFDTRTSLEDLLDIGKIGGRLGVAKDQLAGFTEAIDKAVVALGDDFSGGAEEVATRLGKIKTVFAETRNQKFDVALNNIGSAINELGNAGANTAPSVANFTERIGQLGALAPKVSETLGLGATLEEIGMRADIAAGGLTNILVVAGREQAAFAKQIGVTTKEFQQMLNTSPNEVIKKLAGSFSKLSSSQAVKVMTDLKIGSQESMKVVLGLANNMELLEKRQRLAADAMREGTSLTGEFNIKNNTLQASLDKLNKEWQIITNSS